jgi:hypothetical protein
MPARSLQRYIGQLSRSSTDFDRTRRRGGRPAAAAAIVHIRLMLETMMLPFVMSYLIIGRQPRKRRAINVKPGKAV